MDNLILTCEHGGNSVPEVFRSHVKIPKTVLDSHRGYDKGALKIAKDLSKELKKPLFFSTQTRLLIDYNRSLSNPSLWSSYSKELSQNLKESLIEGYELHRQLITSQIESLLKKKKSVIHLAIHSFTPVLKGKKRTTDIGILYNSKRPEEKFIAHALKNDLQAHLKVRFNYPYLGSSDGLSRFLRNTFKKRYIGLEIEINQALVARPDLGKQLLHSIQSLD